jgi:hypothetical protein
MSNNNYFIPNYYKESLFTDSIFDPGTRERKNSHIKIYNYIIYIDNVSPIIIILFLFNEVNWLIAN